MADEHSGSVSKLKAQLRQTKRLLARDDLTPDVRTTSERRLVLLEAELGKAEQSNIEKKMVQRYRGVKFFERQKLLRKIKQAKKTLADVPESIDAQTALRDARVNLYYVLRYPKTAKYIALFPDGVYAPFVSPSALPADASPAEQKRQALRAAIRAKIEGGELGEEAELGELGIEGEEDVPTAAGAAAAGGKRDRGEEVEEDDGAEQAERVVKKPKRAAPVQKKAPAPAAAEEDEHEEADEAEEAEEAAEGAEPKKKENRKQRKERKRAEQAAAAAGGAPPAVAKAAPAKKEAKREDAGGKSRAEQLVEDDDFFA
ncbi:18S rRNA maturation protein [Rhodotorula kratochvilovae]